MANEVTDEELEDVVPVVVTEFKAALENAKEVLNNSEATQAQVNSAFDRLADIMQKLSFYKGDKEQLIALRDKINSLNKDEFIASTWIKLEGVLTEVNSIIDNENALENEVKEGYNKLIKAYLELRLKPSKDKLQDLINKAESLDASKYTEASYNNVVKALEVAKLALNNDEATEDEIYKAKSTLESALGRLVENNTSNSENNGSNTEDKNNGNDSSNNYTGDNISSNTGNNVSSSTSTNNSSTNSSQKEQGKLPNTGGRAAGVVGIFGAIISALGVSLFKKRR